MSNNNMKISVWGLGLAMGIVGAIAMFVMGLFADWWHWGSQMVKIMASFYVGYTDSFGGAILGAIWGFVDWFIGGVLIAAFYNMLTGKGCCKKKDD